MHVSFCMYCEVCFIMYVLLRMYCCVCIVKYVSLSMYCSVGIVWNALLSRYADVCAVVKVLFCMDCCVCIFVFVSLWGFVMNALFCMYCCVCSVVYVFLFLCCYGVSVMYVLLLHYTLAGTRKIASQLPLVKCLCHQSCYFQHLSIQHGSLCCAMQRITKFIEMHYQIHSPHVSKHVKTSSEPAE